MMNGVTCQERVFDLPYSGSIKLFGAMSGAYIGCSVHALAVTSMSPIPARSWRDVHYAPQKLAIRRDVRQGDQGRSKPSSSSEIKRRFGGGSMRVHGAKMSRVWLLKRLEHAPRIMTRVDGRIGT